MAVHNIAVDLGSKFIGMALLNESKMIVEPACVAVDMNGRELAAGLAAMNMAEGQGARIKLIYPFEENRVKDNLNAARLVAALIGKLIPRTVYEPNVKMYCAVSCGLNTADKKNIERIFSEIGCGETKFCESAVLISRCAFNEFKASGGMIIDMGYSKTDLAIVHNNSILQGATVSLGGKHIDYIIEVDTENKYDFAVSSEMAERIKESCAGLIVNDLSTFIATGIDKKSGRVSEERVSTIDYYDHLFEFFEKIVLVAHSMFNTINDELILQDICRHGIFLCGGTARLYGVDKFFSANLHVPARIPKDCDLLAIKGWM